VTDKKARSERATISVTHTLRHAGQDAAVPGDYLRVKTSQLRNNLARSLEGVNALLTVQPHSLEAAVEELSVVGIYWFDLLDFRVSISHPETHVMERAPAEGSQEAFFKPGASDAKGHSGRSARLAHNQPRRICLT